MRLNTEIDKLNNILKATKMDLENQTQKFTQQIRDLEKQIAEL